MWSGIQHHKHSMPPINMLEVDKASKMAHTSPSDKPVNHLEELGNVVIRRNRVRRSNCIRMDKHSSRVRVSTLTRSWLLKEGTDFSLPADGGKIPLDPEPVSPPAAPPMGSVPKASQLRGGRESRSESFNSEEENCYADNLIDSVEESCYADNIIDSIDNGSVSHTDSVEEYFNYEELDEVLGPKNGSLADSECCSLSSEASNESLTSSMSTCQIQRTVSQNWQKKHLKRATRAVGTHWPFKGTLTNNQITSFLSQSSSQLKELKISQERMQKITEVFRRPLTSIQNSKLKEKFRRRSEVQSDNQSDAMRRWDIVLYHWWVDFGLKPAENMMYNFLEKDFNFLNDLFFTHFSCFPFASISVIYQELVYTIYTLLMAWCGTCPTTEIVIAIQWKSVCYDFFHISQGTITFCKY